jgi:DNA polymerase-1
MSINNPETWHAFDVETLGDKDLYALQPFRATVGQGRIRSFAAAYTAANGAIKATCAKDDDQLQTQLANYLDGRAGKVVVAWNAPFDIAWLYGHGHGERVDRITWLDAMLMYRHVETHPDYTGKRLSYGLKNAVARFYPEHAGYDKGIAFDTTDPDELEKLYTYNKLDAYLTLKLAHKFWSEMSPEQRRACRIEASSLTLVARTFVEGIVGDTAQVAKLDAKLQGEFRTSLKLLQAVAPEVTEEVLASPAQLGTLLYEQWGLTAPKQTDKGADSTDKEALHELAQTDERVSHIHQWRDHKNWHTKFVTGMSDSLAYNGDGKTRPQARVFGTYTGRMTYSSSMGSGVKEVPTGVALHQWKRDTDFRKLIVPPEGYTLMEFDAAGQEYRWMAVMSGDECMLALCEEGHDAHSFMGSRIANRDYAEMMQAVAAGDPEAKRQRQLGKVANLSLQYRTSATRLMTVARVQHGIDMDAETAKAIYKTYHATYPEVKAYWNEQIRQCAAAQSADTFAGRRVRLQGDFNGEYSWQLTSTAINYPIQGSGADQKYLALHIMKTYLPLVGGRFYFELHDGLFFIVPDANAQKAFGEIKLLLDALPYEKAWGKPLPVQFKWDGKMGKSWGDLR